VINRNSVELKWSTVSELNNSGFDVERKSASDWQKIAFVAGSGTSNIVNTYTFSDKFLPSGKYHYRLKQIDYNGNYEYFELSSEVNVGSPDKFALEQNYPNPFNPTTKIKYSIPGAAYVTLKVYDILGNEVETIVSGMQTRGVYDVQWDAAKFASGVYIYKINAGSYNESKMMLLVK
jgi:hypothetical protein